MNGTDDPIRPAAGDPDGTGTGTGQGTFPRADSLASRAEEPAVAVNQ